jgi:hypothetical protein
MIQVTTPPIEVLTTKISLTSNEILNLNSTPIQLLPSPGSGRLYDVMGILCRMNYLTAAYATNLQLQIYYNGAGLVIGSNSNILNATLNKTGKMILSAIASAGATQYLTDTAIYCNVSAGNPTGGSGTLDIYLTYKIITL